MIPLPVKADRLETSFHLIAEKPDPAYGEMKDVEMIIKACHDKGMKIVFDLVINHTSDQHRWFQQSRSSRDSPFRKYYIWRPPRYIGGKRKSESGCPRPVQALI